jgi:hypothetical protein
VLLPSVARNWIGQCGRNFFGKFVLARGRRKGYRKVLQGKEMIPKDDEIIDPVKDQDKLNVRELNEDAYEDLTLSIAGG